MTRLRVAAVLALGLAVAGCGNGDPNQSDPSPSACPTGKAAWTGPRLDGKQVLICAGKKDSPFIGNVPAPIAQIDAAVPKGCAAIRAQYDSIIKVGGASSSYDAAKLSAFAAHARQALADHGCPLPS